MEELARILSAVVFVAIIVFFVGAWLLHSAINAGDFWKAIVALVLIVPSGYAVIVVLGGAASSR